MVLHAALEIDYAAPDPVFQLITTSARDLCAVLLESSTWFRYPQLLLERLLY